MPRVFLCHASEDKQLVEKLARDLMHAGVDTFFDQWEIRAGDSLRQKIDAGITSCTHFIVALSPASRDKPWVNAELDAGFVSKLEGQLVLIPLRIGLRSNDLPPLLRGVRSPSLDDYDVGLRELLSAILGVTDRPSIGPISSKFLRALSPNAGLSILAGRIAAYFVNSSTRARYGDPQMALNELRSFCGLPDDDIAEAVNELEEHGWVKPMHAMGTGSLGFAALSPTPELFAALDKQLMPWDPAADARTLVAEILNSHGGSAVMSVLDTQLGWGPRRLNPAITTAVNAGAVEQTNTVDNTYQFYSLRKNAVSRRFLQ